MAGGGVVAVLLQKLQYAAAHRLGVAGGVGVPQDGEQGPAEAGAVGQLGEEEFAQLALVHLQHVEQGPHLAGQPLLDAGGDHRPLVEGQDGGQALAHAGGVHQPLQEGGEVGIIAQGLIPPCGVPGVLPLRPVVGPADPGGVRSVLNTGIIGGNGHISVHIVVVMTRYRVGHTKQVRHWRHSISVKVRFFFGKS